MKTIAIASGKGGVGKTVIAANLAAALVDWGHSVLLFDADFGLANVDILFGVECDKSLKDVVVDGVELRKIICTGPGEVDLISGGSGVDELLDLSDSQLEDVLQQLAKVAREYDYVIVDTAAGLHPHVLAFTNSADLALFVCTPDPTSLMDCFVALKMLYRVKPDAKTALLVNQADTASQAEIVFNKLKTIVGQFLSKSVLYAGAVEWDETVAACSRTCASLVLTKPKSKPAKQIDELAEWIIDGAGEIEEEDDDQFSLMQRLRSAFSFLKRDDGTDDTDDEEESEESDEQEEDERRTAA
ncbi:MAG: AAA family ATPase [Armatimonadetes bacterium]|nr:AAA family ATPase [Armatimonadota bacterium]